MLNWKIVLLALAIAIIVFSLWADSEMCAYRFSDQGFKSKYEIMNRCMVHDGKEWVTEREFL